MKDQTSNISPITTAQTERQEWVAPTLRDLQISDTKGNSSGPSLNDGGDSFNDYNS